MTTTAKMKITAVQVGDVLVSGDLKGERVERIASNERGYVTLYTKSGSTTHTERRALAVRREVAP